MDEIELLRLFRDDMPGPTTDAWVRARTAIASARSEEEPPGRRRSRWPGRRLRWVVFAAAAVILVAGGTTYGLTAGLGNAGHPAGAVNALTAVSGCPGLAAASGVLERVNGTGLVLKTPGGEPVTVITSASAKVSRQVTGTVSDITNGTHVIVEGTAPGGRIAAQRIIVSTLPKLHGPPPAPHRQGHPSRHHVQRRSPARGGRAAGTVTDASTGGFTLITSGGFHIQVTTSGSTRVYTQATSTVGQLQAGGFTIAVGSAKSDGTLAAATIEQGNVMPRFEHGGGIVAQPWLGCSPSAVATAAFLTAS